MFIDNIDDIADKFFQDSKRIGVVVDAFNEMSDDSLHLYIIGWLASIDMSFSHRQLAARHIESKIKNILQSNHFTV